MTDRPTVDTTTPYQHYEQGYASGDGLALITKRDNADDGYIAFVAFKEGVAVNGFDYSNPPADVMRETVEVMRALVQRFDELNSAEE